MSKCQVCRALNAAILWLGAAVALAGCAGAPQPVPTPGQTIVAPTRSEIRSLATALVDVAPSQAEVLEDGIVTRAEYEHSLGLLLTCFSDGGVGHSTPTWDPVSGTSIGFLITSSEEQGEKCEREYWSQVDGIYTQTATPHMESDLLAATRSCLASQGIVVDSQAKDFNSLAGLPANALVPETADPRTESVKTCVVQGLTDLYPGTSVFTWR